MLVFIDESGDPGMKKRSGTSEYFIVTAVIFKDAQEAELCQMEIEKYRESLGKDPWFEFRFNKCCDDFRRGFLEIAGRRTFFYYSLVLNKSKLWHQGFRDKNSLYKYTVKLVFQNAKPLLTNATVIIDRCGDREFRNQLAKYLKGRMNEPGNTLIRKVKMEASHSNPLLQLADMVCGAVARSYKQGDLNENAFRGLIRHRESRVQLWPK